MTEDEKTEKIEEWLDMKDLTEVEKSDYLDEWMSMSQDEQD